MKGADFGIFERKKIKPQNQRVFCKQPWREAMMNKNYVLIVTLIVACYLSGLGTVNISAATPAFNQIEAESFGSQSGIQTESCSDSGGGQNIGYIANGDYAVYSGIDFDDGATSFTVRAASATNGGNIIL
jgi:hypothetical protein